MSGYPGEGYHGQHHRPQQGYQQQQQQGYNAPPQGPPQGQGYGGGGGGEYGGYAPPQGPPQQQYNSYAPPSGPPGGYGYNNGGGGGGGGYNQNDGGGYGGRSGGGYGGGGGWQAPTGSFEHQGYQTGSGGYAPPSGPPQHYAPPSYAPPRPPTGSQHYGPQFQNQQSGGAQQPYFQYSQCTGKKKALCIGINYIGSSNALSGCINDAHNVEKFIIERFGYRSEDIVILSDDASNSRQIPTRANMIAAMQWLVSGAQPNDSLFFHYSGHGGQTKDLDGDEDDGMDEVIYPLDFKEAGHIVDDDIHTLLVRPLPAGCRLTAIIDACHSATSLDLPYVYSTEGKIKEPNLLAEAGQGILSAGMSYMRGDVGGMMSGLLGLGKQVINQQSGAADKTKQTKTSPADVVSWSGCKDDQTSADTQMANKATGAMSYAFITALTKQPQQSYQQLLVSIREELKQRFDQKPQLSASHPIDCNLLFIA